MEKLSLYGITAEMQALENLWEEAIDEETGEIRDAATLEVLQSDIEMLLQNKATSLVKYCKDRDYFIDNVDQEIKKLQALKKTAVSKQENFKKYIKMCMQKLGIPKLETTNGVLSLRKSESVSIEDEKLIPAEFTTIVQDIKISKTDIKKAIKEGQEVPGASLIQNISLQVK